MTEWNRNGDDTFSKALVEFGRESLFAIDMRSALASLRSASLNLIHVLDGRIDRGNILTIQFRNGAKIRFYPT